VSVILRPEYGIIVVLTPNSMPPTTSPTAEAARELLRKNAALTKRLAELGARGTAAAAALTRPGTPPPDDLVTALDEARREFVALRDEVFAAAAELGLQSPSTETINSTRRLDAMLKLLLEALESAEKQAQATAALAQTVAVLDRIASLAHREDPGFSALANCQSRAADVRAALASTGRVDQAATAPFAALVTLLDGPQKLDDEQWGRLEDAVAAAFGRALAVAATRGKLVKR
jgi:hypothetical protein